MNRADRWFAAPEEADLAEGEDARARSFVLASASRLLVASPAGPPARTIVAARPERRPAESASRLGGALIDAGVRRLQELAPVDDGNGAGSVALTARPAGEAPLPPWDAAARRADGGWNGTGQSWRPERPEDSPLARRLAVLLRPATELLLAASGPLEWPRPLLPYQLVAVRELVSRDSLLLADDMGLGKTVSTLAALRILFRQGRIERGLIVVPAALLTQWRGELRRWTPELRVSTVHGSPGDRGWQWRAPAHLYLTTYETLRADPTTGSEQSDDPEREAPTNERLWDVVVLDEAQKIKNPRADVSRACKRLRRRRQWALTGTPLENSPDDLLSILEFVDPGLGRGLGSIMVGAGLRQQLARVQLRRRKRDVLSDLPPKRVSQIVLPLAPRQRETYDRAEREGIVELRALGERIEVEHVFQLINRLRQICNVCPVSGQSSKLTDLAERLATLRAEGHKALLFTQFANAAYGARAIAARLGPSAVAYTGDLDQSARDRVLQRFRGDPECQALVLSLGAGGQGLNLQEASYVFHVDRWWNPAVGAQAEARSHRLGQRQPVQVYTYVSENTLEERLERILRDKQLLFDELVDGVSIGSAALDEAELFGLVGLAASGPPRADRPLPPDYAAMGDRPFAVHLRRLLQLHGWHVEPPRSDILAGLGFVASRDTAGATVRLIGYAAARPAAIDVEVVRELHALVRADPDGRGVVACPAGLDGEAGAEAILRELTVWDARTLASLEGGGSEVPSRK